MPLPTWASSLQHFGYLGIALMVIYGMLYGLFDSFAERSVEFRAALLGILLSRVLADAGMGLSAISITVVCAGLFLVQAYAVRWLSVFYDWMTGRLAPVPPRTNDGVDSEAGWNALRKGS